MAPSRGLVYVGQSGRCINERLREEIRPVRHVALRHRPLSNRPVRNSVTTVIGGFDKWESLSFTCDKRNVSVLFLVFRREYGLSGIDRTLNY